MSSMVGWQRSGAKGAWLDPTSGLILVDGTNEEFFELLFYLHTKLMVRWNE